MTDKAQQGWEITVLNHNDMSALTDTIKATLDRECAEKNDNWGECPKPIFHRNKLDPDEMLIDDRRCWLCYRHGLLAQRIADDVDALKVTK